MGPQGNMLANLFPVAVIFLIFYFILIRPQQKQQKDFKKMVDEIS